jgi:hypothetical protein
MVSIGTDPRALRPWCIAAALALFCVAPSAFADDETQDLPSRVGRVSDVAGELFLATAERANEWAAIGRNYPVTSADNLWVSADGRAEIDFGAGRFWMAGDANVQIIALDERRLALFVASGRVIVRMRSVEPGDIARIETPNSRIDIVRPGHYRVDVVPDAQRTTLLVRSGEAGIEFAGGVQMTMPGQQVSVSGVDSAQIAIQNGFGSDDFDAWSIAREQRYDASPTVALVAPDMVGARELDDYGTWESSPTYGAVWFPTTVAVGWAPYRLGAWTWVAPWGWTWVDSAPWGYAPSHYGRWVWFAGRWGWCPGTRIPRAVWAPALVGWYGGRHWVNAAGPIYGWVPLGWGEPFIPSWRRCSSRCWRHYNQPFAVALTERPVAYAPARYVNAGAPGALTAVPMSVLGNAQPVAAYQINVSALGSGPAPILGSAAEVQPLAVRNHARPVRAAPVPAGTQYQMMGRGTGVPPARIALPPPGPPSVGVSDPQASRRVPSAVVATPNQGGTVVSAPPLRDVRVAAPAPAAALPSQVYAGVPSGRGAYTGVPPTPGPKAPMVPDHGAPVSAPAALQTRTVPLAVVPQSTAPQVVHGGHLREGETRQSAPARPTVVPAPASAAAGTTPAVSAPQK